MTRKEYNDFRYIQSTCKKFGMPTYGCMYTIPTSGSPEYKQKLHELYTSWNMHPAAIRIDNHYFDDLERIIYIYGKNWKDENGTLHSWEEIYTKEEKAKFAEALK